MKSGEMLACQPFGVSAMFHRLQLFKNHVCIHMNPNISKYNILTE